MSNCVYFSEDISMMILLGCLLLLLVAPCSAEPGGEAAETPFLAAVVTMLQALQASQTNLETQVSFK
jgi:hypothetical protein